MAPQLHLCAGPRDSKAPLGHRHAWPWDPGLCRGSTCTPSRLGQRRAPGLPLPMQRAALAGRRGELLWTCNLRTKSWKHLTACLQRTALTSSELPLCFQPPLLLALEAAAARGPPTAPPPAGGAAGGSPRTRSVRRKGTNLGRVSKSVGKREKKGRRKEEEPAGALYK